MKGVKSHYYGLFSKENMVAGSVVARDGGVVVRYDANMPQENYGVFIEDGLLLVPNDYDNLDPICYLNHSCAANIARIGGLIYIAKRDIAVGDELTIDYAPLVAGDIQWSMECQCGSPNCRKLITSKDGMNAELAKQLWQEWLPHIQKKVMGLKYE